MALITTKEFAQLLEEGYRNRFEKHEEAVEALNNAGIKVSLRSFRRYLKGETSPKLELAAELLDFFGVPKMATGGSVARVPEVELAAHGLRANSRFVPIGRALLGDTDLEKLRVLKLTPGHILPSGLMPGDLVFLEMQKEGGTPIGELYDAGGLAARGIFIVSLGRYVEIARLMEVGEDTIRLMSSLEGYEDLEIDVRSSDLVVYARVIRKMSVYQSF